MKKRSLFAAVAMLVVSAVLMTSATYAWFSTGGPANINTYSASTVNVTSGVMLSVDGGTNWTGTLSVDSATFTAANGNTLASSYTPIDSKDGQEFCYYTVDTTSGGFTNASVPNGAYTELKFDIAVVKGGDNIVAKAIFDTTNSTGLAAARAALLEDDGAGNLTPLGLWVNDTTQTTQSIKLTSGAPDLSALDDSTGTNAFVVDSGDGTGASTYLETQGVGSTSDILAAGTGTVTLTGFTNAYNATNPSIKHLVARIWVEGQDVDCVPTSQPGKSVGVSWNFDN